MKKIFAKISLFAFLATFIVTPNAQATGVIISVSSGDNTTFTINLPLGVAHVPSDTMTVTVKNTATGNAIDLSLNNVVDVQLGTDASNDDAVVSNDYVNGQFTVRLNSEPEAAGADLEFTLNSALPTNTAYTISYSDSDGFFGAAMVNTGTSNQVAVTATVEPTLTFVLDTNTVALGTLPIATDTYANDAGTSLINPTVSTNAAGGVVVDMASAGLATAVAEIGVTDINLGVAPTAALDYYKVSTFAGPNIVDTNDGLANAGGTDMLATQQVYTSNSAPVAAGTVAVTVAARAAATTEAGNYTDTLTFSATATF